MFAGPTIDALEIWRDCYEMRPKAHIRTKEARLEIQRAWSVWDGDKNAIMSKILFFTWLQRFRPYFLTFRCKGDPWQSVHSWLLEYERNELSKRSPHE